jgi:restriction system protein
VPIPDYQQIMLPLLKLAGNGQEWRLRDAADELSNHFRLTDEERSTLLPSGTQPVIYNRVGWARTYLGKAGLLSQRKRGYFEITERGREVLGTNPIKIDAKFLGQFQEFESFRAKPEGNEETALTPEKIEEDSQTPDEVLEQAYAKLRSQLVDEVLASILSCSPLFFEKLVLDLLVALGYGGSRKDAAEATKRSGDDGIDGVIKEDRLGLDTIYVQAKRWAPGRKVGRPDVQQFAGSLQGNRARKGVFITTSEFSRDAYEYAERIDSKIILLDGRTLAGLMIDHGLGVSTVVTYELKRIDGDYFIEE